MKQSRFTCTECNRSFSLQLEYSTTNYSLHTKAGFYAILHILLTLAVGFFTFIGEFGSGFGDGSTHAGGSIYEGLFFLAQPALVIFGKCTNQGSLPLNLGEGSSSIGHRDLLSIIDLLIALFSSICIGYIFASFKLASDASKNKT